MYQEKEVVDGHKTDFLTRSSVFETLGLTSPYIYTPDDMISTNKHFLISWIAASISMFLLSYLWHGVILNDYELISYPHGIFMVASAVVYLLIGFVVSRVFTLSLWDNISRHPLVRGPIVGIVCGLLVYLLTLVVGVGFNKQLELKYMVLDVAWQCFEQAIGGFFVGLVYILIFVPIPQEEEVIRQTNTENPFQKN